MMRDDGERQQAGRSQCMGAVIASRRDEQRERRKDNAEQDRDDDRAYVPAHACGNLQRRHAGVMHRRDAAADDGTSEDDPQRPQGRYRDAQSDEGDGDREDQRQDRHGNVVGTTVTRPVGQHRDEVRRPDAAAADDGIQRDPDQPPGSLRRTRPVKQADCRRAGEQTHRPAECDQTPIMLVRETKQNLIHCRPLFHRALEPAEMDSR